MYFINKLAQALVSFVSTKFVWCNAANGWDVCLKINHKLIVQSCLNDIAFEKP